ncbi:hypothetical protein AgCh_004751 [Apium graveolens]
MQARKMLFAAIPSICASSSKKISIYNEEMIVARCFIGFIIFSRKSLGKTFKVTLDGRIQAIQEESQQFPNPNEVVPLESNEQQRLLRISLRICGTVVESLPMARCAPKCEKTVQALLCRNLNVKSATLPNATSSRRIRLQDDLVTGFHFSRREEQEEDSIADRTKSKGWTLEKVKSDLHYSFSHSLFQLCFECLDKTDTALYLAESVPFIKEEKLVLECAGSMTRGAEQQEHPVILSIVGTEPHYRQKTA